MACKRCLSSPVETGRLNLISFTRSLQRCLCWQDRRTTGGCQSVLVNKFGVSLSQYHHTMVHIANHPGINKRPVEAAVLRRQSHPIIVNLPMNPLTPARLTCWPPLVPPACLPSFTPARLLTCPYFSLPECQPARLVDTKPACLSAWQGAHLQACSTACLPECSNAGILHYQNNCPIS
jgi:hypothetical protein